MKKTSRLFLILSLFYAGIILALGSWWLYLIVQYGEKIALLSGEEDGARILKMVKWEGGTFIGLLILLSGSLLFLYWKDFKKTKGLQAFFASMTHELKTPLASIRLQAEVLKEDIDGHVEDIEGHHQNHQDEDHINQIKEARRLEKVVNRLIEDTNKMENQMDKILQLSRIEGGGNLNLTSLNLRDLINHSIQRWASLINVETRIPEDKKNVSVLGDELAITLILRNLFENTLNHSKTKKAVITLSEGPQSISMTYQDDGEFSGDVTKLGKLFYKHKSNKGTGIGLYLIKKLTETMKGKCVLDPTKKMTINITLQKGEA